MSVPRQTTCLRPKPRSLIVSHELQCYCVRVGQGFADFSTCMRPSLSKIPEGCLTPSRTSFITTRFTFQNAFTIYSFVAITIYFVRKIKKPWLKSNFEHRAIKNSLVSRGITNLCYRRKSEWRLPNMKYQLLHNKIAYKFDMHAK